MILEKLLKNYKLGIFFFYCNTLRFSILQQTYSRRIYQHFKAISQASPIPIIIYNVPGRTSSNMLPKTVLRLANDFQNIVAVKEAAGIWFKLCK
jgi:dihydrodipicolinate synthase/N-acetylneuraminate lyase